MPIIRVAHEAVDLKVLAMPLTCPMRRSAEGCHGYSWTTPQAARPGLTHVNRVREETWHGRGQIREWPAECTCPPPPAPSATVAAGQPAQAESTDQRTHEVALDPGDHYGHSGQKPRVRRSLPGRTRAIPCKVRAVTAEVSMIPKIGGMILAARETSDRVQAGRVHNSLDRAAGLRSREPARRVQPTVQPRGRAHMDVGKPCSQRRKPLVRVRLGLFEDQRADLQVELLRMGQEPDVAQRLVLPG
jgi:hypothetical protein